MSVDIFPTSRYTQFISCSCGGQERVSDVLELKCQSVVSSQVDAGSQTWILYKRRMFS